MSLILSIETSTAMCSVAMHEEGKLIGSQKYLLPNMHSSLLPGVIDQLLTNSGIAKKDLEAIAVSGGPGSYTGLRIGTSTAKGLCMGLNIPLISISCLDSLFESIHKLAGDSLICSLIDARRMEVYCNLRKASGEIIWETKPLIVDETTFSDFPEQNVILIGTGAAKLKSLLPYSNLKILEDHYPQSDYMGLLAFRKFKDSDFENLAYFEPDYLKEFQTKIPN